MNAKRDASGSRKTKSQSRMNIYFESTYSNNYLMVMLTFWFACRRWVKHTICIALNGCSDMVV